MQKAINAFRFNVKLSHCLTRKKKHDLDQETTKKSLECKGTTAQYIHVHFTEYHIMGVWETVQSGYYGTIKARPMHAYTVNSR